MHDPPIELSVLPWDRRAALVRLDSVRLRYDRLLVLASEPPDGKRVWAQLLLSHPTALRELKGIQGGDRPALEVLTARRGEVLAEQANLRAAAPLPPPPAVEARVRPLAVADVEWFLRELRTLVRLGGRRAPESAMAAYRERRPPDPVPWTLGLVRAVFGPVRRSLQTRVFGAFGVRYGHPGLERLIGAAPAPTVERAVDVGASDDLPNGCALRVDAFGEKVAIFRHEDRLYAIGDTCPHRGGALGRGEIVDGWVLCPLHGWPFELASGVYRENRAVCVARYGVDEADGRIRLRAPEDVDR